MGYREKKDYTLQTVRKLIFETNRFIEFAAAQENTDFNVKKTEQALRILLRKTAKGAAIEANERARERFQFVPNLHEVSTMRLAVFEVMEKFSPMGFMYQEYLALTIFLIHSESNGRIGACWTCPMRITS